MLDGVLIDVNGNVWGISLSSTGVPKVMKAVFPVGNNQWDRLRRWGIDLTGVTKVYGRSVSFLLVAEDGSVYFVQGPFCFTGGIVPAKKERYPHFSF
jgi:hypothetical protein